MTFDIALMRPLVELSLPLVAISVRFCLLFPAAIVSKPLSCAPSDRHFQTPRLQANMRVAAGQPDAAQHAQWLLRVRSGDGGSVLELPGTMGHWVLTRNASHGVKMRMLIDFFRPNLVNNVQDSAWLFGQCILAPLNTKVVCI